MPKGSRGAPKKGSSKKTTRTGPRGGASKVKGKARKKGGAEAKLARQRMDLIIRSKFRAVGRKPSSLERTICQYLVEMESSDASSKTFKALRALGIVSAYTQEINESKKAILVFVPFAQLTEWRKIQERVQGELQKKLGQDIIFLVQRKVIKLNQIRNNVPRPRNQTITAVHEALLDDLVFPTKIVGKRLRFQVGGQRLLKVYLDPKHSKEIEPRLSTFSTVYRKLTKKRVKFLFPRYVI